MESIILAFVEKENENLLDKIDHPLDCEASTFAVYMNSEEAKYSFRINKCVGEFMAGNTG